MTLTLDNCRVPAERLSSSPSADHGLSADAEEQLRMRGCELIQAAGILLKLPQVGEIRRPGPTLLLLLLWLLCVHVVDVYGRVWW